MNKNKFNPSKLVDGIKEELVNKILDNLSNNSLWKNDVVWIRPFNPITGVKYKGLNFLNLNLRVSEKYFDPRFLTFNNAKENKLKISKGSKAEQIMFFTIKRNEISEDEILLDNLEKENIVTEEIDGILKYFKETPIWTYHNVFNGRCIENITPYESFFKPNNRIVEDIIEFINNNTDITIKSNIQKTSYYDVTNDIVNIAINYERSESKFSALIHELSHWAMNSKRMGFPKEQNDSSKICYAKEEMVAAFCELIICSDLGIKVPENSSHISYISDWVKIISEKKQNLFKAINYAEKVVDYLYENILNTTFSSLKIAVWNKKDEALNNNTNFIQENIYSNLNN